MLPNRFNNIEPKQYFVPALISAGAGLVGGALQSRAQNKAAEEAEQRRKEAERMLENLPEYEYIQGGDPILEQLPEELQAALISEDPTLKATEMAALQKMQELVDKGMSAQDAYNYMQATQRAGVESRGQQEAIIDEMQRKGMSGSGIEYALRSRAAQGAVDQFAEQQALEAAKKAELQALANIQQAGLAGDIRGEDLQVNSANTNALNQFAMENARNKQAIQAANVNRQNIAAQNELAERRNVQQGNVDLTRSNAAQRSNVRLGGVNQDLAQGVARSNVVGDVGSTVGKAVGAITDYYSPQAELERKKAERALQTGGY